MSRNTEDPRKDELVEFIKWQLELHEKKLDEFFTEEEIKELTYLELKVWAAKNKFVDIYL